MNEQTNAVDLPPIVGHAHTCCCNSETCKRYGCAAIKNCSICHPLPKFDANPSYGGTTNDPSA